MPSYIDERIVQIRMKLHCEFATSVCEFNNHIHEGVAARFCAAWFSLLKANGNIFLAGLRKNFHQKKTRLTNVSSFPAATRV